MRIFDVLNCVFHGAVEGVQINLVRDIVFAAQHCSVEVRLRIVDTHSEYWIIILFVFMVSSSD